MLIDAAINDVLDYNTDDVMMRHSEAPAGTFSSNIDLHIAFMARVCGRLRKSLHMGLRAGPNTPKER